MGNNGSSPREQWGSNFGFIMAAAGSAVGLGNIWKFPYITGMHGGAAFLLVYLLCILSVGVPIMLCEITIGRNTQRNPVGAFQQLCRYQSRSILADLIGGGLLFLAAVLAMSGRYGAGGIAALAGAGMLWFGWVFVGFLNIFLPFVITTFYGVVGGWTIAYIVKAFSGGLAFSSGQAAGAVFLELLNDPCLSIFYQVIFMLLSGGVLWFGVRAGIERCSKIFMPMLFFILLALVVRGISLPGAGKGIAFVLSPDFSKLSATGVLEALGHAFFTLSLGMGITITYGSYLRKEQNIFTSSLSVVCLDTTVAVMAALAIFPACFAMGFSPSRGPGLVFQVLPIVFNQIPGGMGWLWSGLFFILLTIAAWTSTISLLEVCVSYCIDQLKMRRRTAVVLITLVITMLGTLSAVSAANWDKLPLLHSWLVSAFGTVPGSFFDLLDNFTSQWLLPVSGLAIALFTGWIWGTKQAVDEIRHGASNFADVHLLSLLAGLRNDAGHNSEVHVLTLASLWGIFIRFITPLAVMAAFLHVTGLL